MIHGIGTDIVRIERIKQAVERWGDKFLKRVYNELELEYSMRHTSPYPRLAARFAAKEAAIKALGGPRGVKLKDIKVVTAENGKPSIHFHGERASSITGFGAERFHISLSHDHEYATAFVMVESKNPLV